MKTLIYLVVTFTLLGVYLFTEDLTAIVVVGFSGIYTIIYGFQGKNTTL